MQDALGHLSFCRLYFSGGETVRFVDCDALRGDINVFYGEGEHFTDSASGKYQKAREELIFGIIGHGIYHCVEFVGFQVFADDFLPG